MTTTVAPRWAASIAACKPAGPPPTTATSVVSIIHRPATDRHARFDGCHTAPNHPRACDMDRAVVADAHSAKKAARCARSSRLPERAAATGEERRCDAFALVSTDWRAVDCDAHLLTTAHIVLQPFATPAAR